jgi:NAD(P)-dependent dehydrogenase (short-subunit alcohol dehydrogenase family)
MTVYCGNDDRCGRRGRAPGSTSESIRAQLAPIPGLATRMNRLDRRTALITGAGHGIGRACARRLAAEGAAVVIADIDNDAAQRAAAELAETGARGIAVECDITDTNSVTESVNAAVSEFGALDVLVNNAGGDELPSDVDFPDDAYWARMLDLNLTGVVRCVRAALPHLLAAPRGGAVVTIGSINGLVAARSEPYSAAKAGLQNLTINLSTRYAAQGVRFNLIAPGTIRTRVWDDQPDDLARLTALYPLGRIGTPDDIAAAVAFLASDDSAWITGVTLPIDGGLLAAGPIRW